MGRTQKLLLIMVRMRRKFCTSETFTPTYSRVTTTLRKPLMIVTGMTWERMHTSPLVPHEALKLPDCQALKIHSSSLIHYVFSWSPRRERSEAVSITPLLTTGYRQHNHASSY